MIGSLPDFVNNAEIGWNTFPRFLDSSPTPRGESRNLGKVFYRSLYFWPNDCSKTLCQYRDHDIPHGKDAPESAKLFSNDRVTKKEKMERPTKTKHEWPMFVLPSWACHCRRARMLTCESQPLHSSQLPLPPCKMRIHAGNKNRGCWLLEIRTPKKEKVNNNCQLILLSISNKSFNKGIKDNMTCFMSNCHVMRGCLQSVICEYTF